MSDKEQILEARIAALEARMNMFESTYYPAWPKDYTDCQCPPGSVCVNSACPRLLKATC